MSAPGRLEVRLTATSGLRLAATAVAVLVVLLALERARTVLHWLVTAGAAALLLDGPVRALAARQVRRGLAVACVTVAVLLGAALLTYGAVDAVVEQYAALTETAPAAVGQLVGSGPLEGLGSRGGLVDRTREVVDQAPHRLFGSPASAARTAAERLGEVTLVVTLTVFMLVAYERFEERVTRMSATGVLWRWSGVDAGLAVGASRARSVVARAVAGGALVAALGLALDVPAPVVLGLWAAWWRLLPVLGLLVAVAPLALLVLADHGPVVGAAALLLLTAAEAVGRARWPGPSAPGAVPMAFLSAVAFVAGFELAGVTGSVVTVVLVHLAVGVAHGAVGEVGDQGPSRSAGPATTMSA